METTTKMKLRTCRVLIDRLPQSLSTSQQPSQAVPKNKVSNKHLYCPASPPDSSHLTYTKYEKNINKKHKIHHKKGEKKCKLCGYSTKYSTHMKYHILTHTGEKPYSCQFCNKGFRSNTPKKHHEIICKLNPKHSDPNWIKMQKTFKCNYCDFSTLTKGRLKDHLQTHTAFKYRPFPCTLCSFRALSITNLANHIRTHTGERPFECPSCDYRAPRTSQLHQHINACHNEGNRPKFQCKTCPKSYFKKFNLNSHMMTHTGERPHSCQFCQTCFIRKSDKNSHENICKINPNPVKKKKKSVDKVNKCFKCTDCEFSAATRWQLRNHSVKHLTVRPFKCKVCDKHLKTNGLMKLHMRTHRKEKPYKCNLCNRRFSDRTSLNNHIRVHIGEKPYSCQFCQKCFVVSPRKKKHEITCKLNPNKTK